MSNETKYEAELRRIKPSYEIEIPRVYEKARGILATTGPNKCLITYRGTKMEKAKLRRAAMIVGVPLATFMRNICNDFADKLLIDAGIAIDTISDDDYNTDEEE